MVILGDGMCKKLNSLRLKAALLSFLLMKQKDLANGRFGFLLAPYCSKFRVGHGRSVFVELGFCMNGSTHDHVDERRAAILLGMPQSELRRYSRASGLGHVENDDKGPRVFFTYEELRRICLLVAQSSK